MHTYAYTDKATNDWHEWLSLSAMHSGVQGNLVLYLECELILLCLPTSALIMEISLRKHFRIEGSKFWQSKAQFTLSNLWFNMQKHIEVSCLRKYKPVDYARGLLLIAI